MRQTEHTWQVLCLHQLNPIVDSCNKSFWYREILDLEGCRIRLHIIFSYESYSITGIRQE